MLLRSGIEPNNYELNSLLSSFYNKKIIGTPYYSPVKQRAYEASDKEAYNHTFKTFKEDIETTYEANIEANNKAVAMREYYDLETNKIKNAIAKLSLRVENTINLMNSNMISKQYVQAFDDYYDVEFYGNNKRNIPYTTAFIDLMQKKVYTEKSNAKTNKLNIIGSNITFTGTTQFVSYETKGQIENILNDTLDSLFILSCKSNDQIEKQIEINIDLKSLVTINAVMFSFTSSKTLTCELSLSEDNENFVSVHDVSNKNLIEWNFPSKTVRYLKIKCIKTEPDGHDIGSDQKEYFEYYYVLKNISVAMESFENKSVFVSKKIDFNDLVNSIRLDATDMIYNNTRIDYFIGFDNGVSKIGWDKIDNHKDHDLFMFQKNHKIANYHLDKFGDKAPDANKLYEICEIPRSVNQNSIKITPTYNMWAVKRYRKREGDPSGTAFSFNNLNFNEYSKQCDIDSIFMDCENYNEFVLEPNVLYIFTQYISIENNYNVYNKFIKIMDSAFQSVIVGSQQKVFINGVEVVPTGESYYSFALKKGVNKVQIVIYSPSTGGAYRKLYHNLNFKEATNDVFGFTPMKYINWSILDSQMAQNYSYYTIKNNKIYVKIDPSDMIKSDLEDMGYFISYYSLREDMANYFNSNKLSFRIMAVLHSSDPNVSPEILNFRITGK